MKKLAYGFRDSLVLFSRGSGNTLLDIGRDIGENLGDNLALVGTPGILDMFGTSEIKPTVLDMGKEASVLRAGARKRISAGNFALPEGRRYPTHDINHARNALARVSQYGSVDERQRVRSAVESKYPSLAKRAADQAKPFHGYNPKVHARTGGLSAAGRAKFKREEGADLKPPVTESNPTGERAARRKSFCARMSGVPGPTSKDGKLTRKGAALKRWRC